MTPLATVSHAEPTRSSPTANASAPLVTLSTVAESALFHAEPDTSPSREDAPSVLSTPSSDLKSTDAIVLPVSTRTTSESAKNLSSDLSNVLPDNISIPTTDVLLVQDHAKPVPQLPSASPAPPPDTNPTPLEFV